MDRRAKFSRATNYALYYGRGRANELALYDMAIVEPAGQSIYSLREFKASGTLAIAYLSVMEIPPWSEDVGLLKTSDFLRLEGKETPYINPQYGNYWLDLRSPRWTDLLLQRVAYLLDEVGYDGLFLDTVGYVESLLIPTSMRSELLQAAVQIVSNLRRRFPDHLMIQNCGLEALYSRTAGYIDGICWENPPFDRAECQDWVAQVVHNLEQVKEIYGVQVLLLVEEHDLCAQQFHLVQDVALAKQFLVYYAPTSYTAGVSAIN